MPTVSVAAMRQRCAASARVASTAETVWRSHGARRYGRNTPRQGSVPGILVPATPPSTRFASVTSRMAIALASLISGIVALYLHLWKLGLTGSLACSGSGGCEYIQGSRYGWFLGVDVALIGAVGYSLLFLTGADRHVAPFRDRTLAEHGAAAPDLAGGAVHAAAQVRRVHHSQGLLPVVRRVGGDHHALRDPGGDGSPSTGPGQSRVRVTGSRRVGGATVRRCHRPSRHTNVFITSRIG